MTVNLEQFHQVFYEESFEGLDIMESSLMELDPNNIDDETINAIFRSAHSIKGGSATFGFSSIAEFTHVLETLLDQVRSGKRGLSSDDINLYLRSVDCMREMLGLLQSGEDGRTALADELKVAFESILTGDNNDSGANSAEESIVESAQAPIASAVDSPLKQWRINLSVIPTIFETGNDPLRFIRTLSEFGEYSTQCHSASLPSLAQIDHGQCYLNWEILLESTCTEEDIIKSFEWIEDECDLEITCIDVKSSVWEIFFEPEISILRTGNEPLRLIRELGLLGEISIESNVENLPDLISMDVENCYFSWNIRLASEASKEDILEVFEWVIDDAKIEVNKVSAKVNGAENSSLETASNTVDALQVPENKKEVPAEDSQSESKALTKSKPVKKSAPEPSSIRVGIDKVDTLINMVGELVITQSMLGQLGADHELDRVPNLMEGLSQLEQNTRELQESVMKIRMLPISFAFSRFPRMVRDLGQQLGKEVTIEMSGEQTELDKTVMEKIGDPMVHLVRNAVDHGIELPDERLAKGKAAVGKITLNAYHQSGNVVIEIFDDGKGLDRDMLIEKAIQKNLISDKESETMSDAQVFDLIFSPGFSTAAQVSDVSGRGVGMDVVKRNILALNGVVEIKSEKDKGSRITIKLPLTLAILDGQLVRVGDQTYVFPLVSIIESLQCKQDFINNIAGGSNVFKLREDYVPIVELYKAFNVTPDSTNMDDSLLVVVESDGEKIGVVVDDLLAQQQVVIKSLEQNFKRVVGVSGATILGDGTVALILDIPGIIALSSINTKDSSPVLQRSDDEPCLDRASGM
ncbi:MAG: two-component system chemotaxis sensor kinase CheA [Flavobacteriales bacterium]|jgi:two-component system chemotaxis sensor kinase CheA